MNAVTTQEQKNTEPRTPKPAEEVFHINQNVKHATIDNKHVESSKEQQSNIPDQNKENMTNTKQFDEAPSEVNVAKDKNVKNPGVIAGVVAGVILLLIIVTIIIIFLIKNRDSSESTKDSLESDLELTDGSPSIVLDDFNSSEVKQEIPSNI